MLSDAISEGYIQTEREKINVEVRENISGALDKVFLLL